MITLFSRKLCLVICLMAMLGLSTVLQRSDTAEAQTESETPTDSTPSTATPYPTASTNEAWTPVTKTFDDGVVMVQVPPGCFNMGSTDTDIGMADAKPVTKTCFHQPFWIDKTDVTNGQFNLLMGQAKNASHWTGDNQPRESITWFEARDFCVLRGARLPTEAEWEFAAKGPDSLIYPWGNNAPTSDLAVYDESQTADVGSKLKGASWVGALDMAGNVWQWTNTIYDQTKFPYPYSKTDGRETNNNNNIFRRVLRGGSFVNNYSDLRSAVRFNHTAVIENLNDGFRCARS